MGNDFKCNSGIGSVVSITCIAFSDLKRDKDGKLKLKRKYGKFNRPVVTYDWREPEVIGLA